jgi:RNA polymerase sigma-70 factor, ECF subfamily
MEPLVAAPVAAEPAVAAGASTPWPELVRVVHSYMRTLVGPSRELEDLSQSALEQVVRSMHRFEGRAELSTFAYRICAHVAMNHWRWWRRWLRRFDLGTAFAAETVTSADAPALAIERERARRLHQALARLAPVKRLCVTLADLEELPASRVAEILDCPEPTVRSRLRQARIELAALLKDDPFFSDDPGGGA